MSDDRYKKEPSVNNGSDRGSGNLNQPNRRDYGKGEFSDNGRSTVIIEESIPGINRPGRNPPGTKAQKENSSE